MMEALEQRLQTQGLTGLRQGTAMSEEAWRTAVQAKGGTHTSS